MRRSRERSKQSKKTEGKKRRKSAEDPSDPARYIHAEYLGNNEWEFKYPRIGRTQRSMFHRARDQALEDDPARGTVDLLRLLRKYPEYTHASLWLSHVLMEAGHKEKAFKIMQMAVDLGISALPEEFDPPKSELPWRVPSNRPFLEACYGLAIAYMDDKKFKPAARILAFLMGIEHEDRQEAGIPLIDCFFRIDKPEGALDICDFYPEDEFEEAAYGKALALYRLNRMDEAGAVLHRAMETWPEIARELAKKRHPEPNPETVPAAEIDNRLIAYDYWLYFGEIWKQSPGALAWLRETLDPDKYSRRPRPEQTSLFGSNSDGGATGSSL